MNMIWKNIIMLIMITYPCMLIHIHHVDWPWCFGLLIVCQTWGVYQLIDLDDTLMQIDDLDYHPKHGASLIDRDDWEQPFACDWPTDDWPTPPFWLMIDQLMIDQLMIILVIHLFDDRPTDITGPSAGNWRSTFWNVCATPEVPALPALCRRFSGIHVVR